MLSDYMARMEIIPRGDARGGGSRGGSRAASRATSAGSDNFVVASNLSDADCMPYDGHDQQVSDSSSDDEADLSAAPRPPTASGSASSAAAAAASSGRPPTATASGGSGGAGFGFDRVASTPERPRPLNGFDLRPATSAVLGGSLSLSGASSGVWSEPGCSATGPVPATARTRFHPAADTRVCRARARRGPAFPRGHGDDKGNGPVRSPRGPLLAQGRPGALR